MAHGGRRLAGTPAPWHGWRRGWRHGWRRGGFTLIEVMLALMLVLALGAVSWASLSPLRNRVAMEEASAAVATGIDQARTLAATSNRVLEVRASIEADALEIQARALGGDEDGQTVSRGAGGREVVDRELDARAQGAADERPWKALMRIVGSFAREDPFADDASGPGEEDRAVARRGEAGGGDEAEYVLIGVALPDGSMVAAVPLRLKDSQGRWSVVRVGTWTTRVEVEMAERESDEDEAGTEADGMVEEGMEEGGDEAGAARG